MKRIWTLFCVLGLLAACQSTDTKTAALEEAASQEQQTPIEVSESSQVQATDDPITDEKSTQSSEPIIVGDAIMAYRPPPIGTKMRWRLAGRRGVRVSNSIVTSHNDTFKGNKVWTTRGDEFAIYWSFSNNRLGRTFLDGSPKEESSPSRELYSFPMKPGDTWTTSYRQIDKKPDRRRTLNGNVKVIGWENITTPAGKFKTMKMSAKFTSNGGRWTRTSWYSPDMGFEVKGNDSWKGGRFSWTLVNLELP